MTEFGFLGRLKLQSQLDHRSICGRIPLLGTGTQLQTACHVIPNIEARMDAIAAMGLMVERAYNVLHRSSDVLEKQSGRICGIFPVPIHQSPYCISSSLERALKSTSTSYLQRVYNQRASYEWRARTGITARPGNVKAGT